MSGASARYDPEYKGPTYVYNAETSPVPGEYVSILDINGDWVHGVVDSISGKSLSLDCVEDGMNVYRIVPIRHIKDIF